MSRVVREPGRWAGIRESSIYEVWGDVVEGAADASTAVIEALRSYLAGYFDCQVAYTVEDDRPFLALGWGDLILADMDARPFGDHLDVYAILALRGDWGQAPDPAAKIARLSGGQRRDLQLFQTLLKRAMDEVLEALDEGRLV